MEDKKKIEALEKEATQIMLHLGEYICLICGHREKLKGKLDDGPIVVNCRASGIKVTYSCSMV